MSVKQEPEVNGGQDFADSVQQFGALAEQMQQHLVQIGAVADALAQFSAQVRAHSEEMRRQAAISAAPKRILRDASGRAVGVDVVRH